MYYGGTNQETKVQRSRKIGKEEQEKWVIEQFLIESSTSLNFQDIKHLGK